MTTPPLSPLAPPAQESPASDLSNGRVFFPADKHTVMSDPLHASYVLAGPRYMASPVIKAHRIIDFLTRDRYIYI